MSRFHVRLIKLFSLTALLAVTSCAGQDIVLIKNAQYTQDFGGAPVLERFLFEAQATFLSGAFTGGTLTYPGPASPATLSPVVTFELRKLAFFPAQAAMDAEYPFGTYTFNLTGGSQGPNSFSIDYTQDLYPSAVPAFTPDTVSALLMGPDPAQPFTLMFNDFTPSLSASSSNRAIVIFDFTTGQTAFSQSLSPGTTSLDVPANTFVQGHLFQLELIFDSELGSGTKRLPFFRNTKVTFTFGFSNSFFFDWFFSA